MRPDRDERKNSSQHELELLADVLARNEALLLFAIVEQDWEQLASESGLEAEQANELLVSSGDNAKNWPERDAFIALARARANTVARDVLRAAEGSELELRATLIFFKRDFGRLITAIALALSGSKASLDRRLIAISIHLVQSGILSDWLQVTETQFG